MRRRAAQSECSVIALTPFPPCLPLSLSLSLYVSLPVRLRRYGIALTPISLTVPLSLSLFLPPSLSTIMAQHNRSDLNAMAEASES